uniref:DNA-cytosine methyltransferase n=1 Tax=Klebsiella pneumoniae TaxID=573 RepID=A0A8B0STX7_KLEPN|nr:DNA-cytosine methyltransferase [Klebsiella pneumoniae]
MVVFLHWLTKPTKAAAGIGTGEQETLHRVATRLPQPRKAVGCFHTLGYHLHCRFSEDGCTERQKPTAL